MIKAHTEKKRELIPPGNYIARCYSMIHLGTAEDEIMGEKKRLNKVRVTWELPSETRVYDAEQGPKPMVISKEYTLSMHEKANLRRDIESWTGKSLNDAQAADYDITSLLGKPCMINVIKRTNPRGDEYVVISSITSLPKGLSCPDAVNRRFEWNFEDCYDERALEVFPDFIKDRIKKSEEYIELTKPAYELLPPPDVDDSPVQTGLPF
jgi:hypothetical protein